MTGTPPEIVGRYALYDVIAQGGMASVHFGRVVGTDGFSRVVAIKRLHRQLANEPEFVTMLLDEARLSSRVRHPNVVSVVDVVRTEAEVLLVMDYVHGVSLSQLLRAAADAKASIPAPIVAGILVPALLGLHAAHSAHNEQGEPLCLVHRDVSPQNILVAAVGTTHVVDFGISKANGRLQTTRSGIVKGKPSYMSPEQATDGEVDARTDVFAAGVVLWEMLTLQKLFSGSTEAAVFMKVVTGPIDRPRRIAPDVAPELEEVVMRALERSPDARWQTALAFAEALERAAAPASAAQVAKWSASLVSDHLQSRERTLAELERTPPVTKGTSPALPPPGAAPGAVGTSVASEATVVTRPDAQVLDPAGWDARPARREWVYALASLALLGGISAAAFLSWKVAAPGARADGVSGSTLPVLRSAAPSTPATLAGSALPPEVEPELPPSAPLAPSPSSAPTTKPGPTTRQPAPPKQPVCELVASRDERGIKVFKKQCR